MDLPTKTALPDLVNTKLANTVDFHVATTNFNSVVKDFTNHFALYKHYRSRKKEGNPIEAEAQFWADVVEGLDLQSTAKTPLAGKYIQKIKAKLTPLDVIVTGDNGEPDIIEDNGLLHVQVVNNGNQRLVPIEEDTDETVRQMMADIKVDFKLQDIEEDEFLLFWVEEYHRAHAAVKERVRELIDVDDSILQEFSDSIGFIVNQSEFLNFKSTPYWDTEFKIGFPTCLNPITSEKLSLKQQTLGEQLMARNGSLFRTNASQLVNSLSADTMAHGENLVTNTSYYARMNSIRFDYLEIISDSLSGLYRVYAYISTNKIANKQKILPVTFQQVIENQTMELDLLNKKVKRYFNSTS